MQLLFLTLSNMLFTRQSCYNANKYGFSAFTLQCLQLWFTFNAICNHFREYCTHLRWKPNQIGHVITGTMCNHVLTSQVLWKQIRRQYSKHKRIVHGLYCRKCRLALWSGMTDEEKLSDVNRIRLHQAISLS